VRAEGAVNRPLIRRIAWEHRHLVIPIVVLMVLNAVLYGAVIFPVSRRVGNVTERRQQAANELASARFAHTRAAAALNGKSAAARELDRFYRTVLPTDLAAARHMVYPRLRTLAEQADLRAINTAFDQVKERDHTLQELKIHMQLTGSYAGIRDFIHRLERNPEFVVIERVVLKENADAAPLSLQIDLATYYKEEAR
jgi:Tfp pilus assembly protein PilO